MKISHRKGLLGIAMLLAVGCGSGGGHGGPVVGLFELNGDHMHPLNLTDFGTYSYGPYFGTWELKGDTLDLKPKTGGDGGGDASSMPSGDLFTKATTFKWDASRKTLTSGEKPDFVLAMAKKGELD